jgi:hypothetical protein
LSPQEQLIAIANDFWAAGRRRCLAAELTDPALITVKCRQESLYFLVPGVRIGQKPRLKGLRFSRFAWAAPSRPPSSSWRGFPSMFYFPLRVAFFPAAPLKMVRKLRT